MSDVWFFTLSFLIVVISLIQNYNSKDMDSAEDRRSDDEIDEINEVEEFVLDKKIDIEEEKIIEEKVLEKKQSHPHRSNSKLRNMILSSEIIGKKYKI